MATSVFAYARHVFISWTFDRQNTGVCYVFKGLCSLPLSPFFWISRNAPPKELLGESCVTFRKRLRGRLGIGRSRIFLRGLPKQMGHQNIHMKLSQYVWRTIPFVIRKDERNWKLGLCRYCCNAKKWENLRWNFSYKDGTLLFSSAKCLNLDYIDIGKAKNSLTAFQLLIATSVHRIHKNA